MMTILTRIASTHSTVQELTRISLVRTLLGLVGVVVLLFLGAYHQPYYPRTWIDEGFVLQGAINIVEFGQYAMRSSEGFRVLDQPLIANGPGIVLPISAVFALFGPGLLQARLLMVVFFVFTAFIFFIVARRLYNTPVALVSLFCLLAVPTGGFLLYGRQALGNVPALGYFLAGYLLWLVALERAGWQHPVAAGALFGLAMITKGQYGLLLPMLVLVGLLDWFYYQAIGLKKIALVLLTTVACLALWYTAQFTLVGWSNIDQHLEAVRSSSQVTVFALRPSRILGNLAYLVRSGLILFLAPGLIYAAWSCRKRSLASCRQLLLLVFVGVWLFWYAFISVGWPRYAFAPAAIGMLLAGKFIVDSLKFVRPDNQNSGSLRDYLPSKMQGATILLLTLIIVVAVFGFSVQLTRLFEAPNRSPQKLAGYLLNNVESQAVIESWEWEIDALAARTYHHPTNDWVDKYTAVLQFGEPLEERYDPAVYRPAYIIDGPFSKWTGIYNEFLAEECCVLLFSADLYDLYEVKE